MGTPNEEQNDYMLNSHNGFFLEHCSEGVILASQHRKRFDISQVLDFHLGAVNTSTIQWQSVRLQIMRMCLVCDVFDGLSSTGEIRSLAHVQFWKRGGLTRLGMGAGSPIIRCLSMVSFDLLGERVICLGRGLIGLGSGVTMLMW